MNSLVRPGQAERLLEISRELTSTSSLECLLHRIVEAAAGLTNTESAGILLYDESAGELRFVAVTSFAEQLFDILVPVEQSIAGAAFASGQAVVVPDVEADPRYYRAIEQRTGFKARSLLAVPLQFKQRRVGVLEVENKRDDSAFAEEDIDTLTVLAAQATIAIENARLVETLQHARGELERQAEERERLLGAVGEQQKLAEALRQASAALSSTLNYADVLKRILEQISRLVPNDAANVMLIEGDGQTARVFLGRGYERFGTAATLDSTTLDVSRVDGLRQMQQTGRPLLVPDVDRDEGWVYSRPEHTWIKSYIGVPIRVRDHVVGFLNVMSATPGFFDRADAERLEAFAYHTAIAIENARLYAQAQQELAERTKAEAELRKHRDHLEELVEERLAEIKRINAQLEAQNAELDAFAHTVAHDLKNPLGIIAGGVQLLAGWDDSQDKQQLAEVVQLIAQGAFKAANIVDNLLLLSSAHKMAVIAEPVDMAAIVREAQDRLAAMIQEHQPEISLPDADAWPSALGYAPWIEEVWVNYLSNALKYGGRPPRLELGWDEGERPSAFIRFWVRDNGHGLTPEEQSRLFTPFERLGQAQIKGHGLGLSIVRRMVEKLGGQVGVESEPGQGSVFYFTLPAAYSGTFDFSEA